MNPTQLNLEEINSRIASELLRNLAWNTAFNWKRIKEDTEKGQGCVSDLPRARGDVPAIILGSGPTLDQSLLHLYGFRGVIFAGPSQAYALDVHGIYPDFVVAVDTHEMVADQLSGIEWPNSTLITHQAIAPQVLDTWKGRRRYVHLVISEEDNITGLMYPWLRIKFTPHGCTPNAMFQIARWLGYRPIYLAGVDFGFPGTVKSATRYLRAGHARYVAAPPDTVNLANDGIYEEEGILITREMMFYKLMFLSLWKLYHIPVIRWGEERSAMPEVKSVPYGETIDDTDALVNYLPDEATIDAKTIPYGLHATAGGIVKAGDLARMYEAKKIQLAKLDEKLVSWNCDRDGVWSKKS